ncbi:hypothetical protein ACIBI9_40800 [Nonomuraea sp. NPDC050451]|uniref:hypothetical protein n=1 Tax=Nonomuraea sp. NPDC050451 TaxID=3364364 RepID=UPI003792DA48
MESGGYFDTASIGLVPEAVRAAVGACYDAMGRGTRGSREWRPVVERAHRGGVVRAARRRGRLLPLAAGVAVVDVPGAEF